MFVRVERIIGIIKYSPLKGDIITIYDSTLSRAPVGGIH